MIVTTSWRETSSVIAMATVVKPTTASVVESTSRVQIVELGIVVVLSIVVELRTLICGHSHD